MSHDQHFKALHGYRRECCGAVIILAGYFHFLGHWYYGGLLEICQYYRLDQGEVENVSEDTCQLNALSTLPGNPSDPAAL